jgi:hypothetical protein
VSECEEDRRVTLDGVGLIGGNQSHSALQRGSRELKRKGDQADDESSTGVIQMFEREARNVEKSLLPMTGLGDRLTSSRLHSELLLGQFT